MSGRRPLPPRPDADPFHRAPEGFEAQPAGAILRSRVVELAAFGIVPLRISAWQLLYRTSDLNGTAEAAVTTVLLPRDCAPGRPLVSFHCAIDAVAPQCFPSYALRRGARAIGAIPQLELPLIAAALDRGWVVSVPDHGGSEGRFGVAREPGHRALDGVRAALNFVPLGLNSRTPIALWGYSGGGLATAWAAELAETHAPELNIVGAVAGSPVGDPGAAFERLNGTVFAGFAMVFTAGLRRGYPDLDTALRATLQPRYLAMLAEAEVSATFPLLARLARRDVGRYAAGGLPGLLDTAELRAVLADILPGRRAPRMPMLIVQGVHDEVIAVDDVDALVRRYEAAGADIGYLRDRLSAHLPLEFLAVPVMVDWLADRFAGRPTTPGTRTVWSVAVTRRALAGHRRLAALSVRLLTGRRIRGAPPRAVDAGADTGAAPSRRASIAETGRSRA
ncbi:lipase family protein [Nocardia cerradoensis]|uniref:lipase family protein n=1 Tax=Nocardia cerradoensis TaxID=85688 RepID=UPI0002DF18DB|nr:lipase family protein [Nocardia cerradoensis]NKY46146.1 lipase [Nocardia cerradoensis]